MRFQETYDSWKHRRLTQAEAAELLGVCERTFRRHIARYEAEGMDGLLDRRLEQLSHRRAPVDEVMQVANLYRKGFRGWNVKHFYSWYKQDGGSRSYTWVKSQLQKQGLVKKAKGKGEHRKRRERSAMEGMMVHQDASTHEWVEGCKWDLVVTMDDATSEHYSMFFVEEEGTASSFKGVQETVEAKGLFCSLYTDRGSHYWHTPVAGGKVDKSNPTQFGRAMSQLGIQMIPAYSPEARGRSERAFKTHQGRLPNELKKAGVKSISEANRYLKSVYIPAYNKEFKVMARERGTAFVTCIASSIREILCEHHERTVTKDNCVEFEGMALQIPANVYRMNYVKAKVRVHRYIDGEISVFHGPRCVARYTHLGELMDEVKEVAA